MKRLCDGHGVLHLLKFNKRKILLTRMKSSPRGNRRTSFRIETLFNFLKWDGM